MNGGHGSLLNVGTDEDGALLDALLPAVSLRPIQSRMVKSPRQSTGDVTSCLSEARSERAIHNDGPDAGKNERDGGKKMRAQLTQPRRRGRVLNLRPGRCAGGLGQRPFFVVRSGDNRNPLARDAEASQVARGRGGCAGIFEEREDERVHVETVMQNAGNA